MFHIVWSTVGGGSQTILCIICTFETLVCHNVLDKE